jgi:hypothetical protein
VLLALLENEVHRLLPKGWSNVLNEMQDRTASGIWEGCYIVYSLYHLFVQGKISIIARSQFRGQLYIFLRTKKIIPLSLNLLHGFVEAYYVAFSHKLIMQIHADSEPILTSM